MHFSDSLIHAKDYTQRRNNNDPPSARTRLIRLLGRFAHLALNFIILAFIIFLMVRQINRMRGATPPPPPPENVQLLREIRDALKK